MRGGTRPGAGRPILPAEEKRSVRVVAYLTPGEADALDAVRGTRTRASVLVELAQLVPEADEAIVPVPCGS